MRSAGRFERAAFAAVIVAGCALRWVHLGTPSLWWDEIVEIETAAQGGFGDVLREVRQGIPPGAGNAGAVPLDYLLLHLWLRLVPLPAPGRLETYFRFPAFLASLAALGVTALGCRRWFDRNVALVASLLLALSIPHVLYAAEARFYSLFVLVTLLNLCTLANLLEHEGSARAWALYGVVGVTYLSTGLLAGFVLAVQYLVLGSAILRHRRGRRRLARLVASAALPALLAGAYLASAVAGVTYGRTVAAGLGAVGAIRDTLAFFAIDNPVLLAAFALGLPFAVLHVRRRFPSRLPLVLSLLACFLAIPAIVVLARWKHYYFHVRHALFLLPAFVVLSALGLLGFLEIVDPFRLLVADPGRRRDANVLAAAALIVATQAPVVGAYLAEPATFFARTKTLHDMRGFVSRLAGTATSLAPGERIALFAERQSMPNASLSLYLRWYGLDDRVVLRGTADVGATLAALAAPRARPADLALAPFVRVAVGLTPDFRRLLGLEAPIGTGWEGVRRAAVLAYSPVPANAPVESFVRRAYLGFTTFETAP